MRDTRYGYYFRIRVFAPEYFETLISTTSHINDGHTHSSIADSIRWILGQRLNHYQFSVTTIALPPSRKLLDYETQLTIVSHKT